LKYWILALTVLHAASTYAARTRIVICLVYVKIAAKVRKSYSMPVECCMKYSRKLANLRSKTANELTNGTVNCESARAKEDELSVKAL